MMALGLVEIIVVGLLLGPASGAVPSELVSLLNAEGYLKHNNIPLQADKLIELIGKAPTDNRGRITQLLAIRWLEENTAKLGDHKKAAETTLKKLADGPQGFARDHGIRALARVTGQSVPVLNPLPKDSVRQGLEWFPENMSFVGAIDLRPAAGQKSLPADAPLLKDFRDLQAKMMEFMGPRGRDEFYRFAETVGNFRLDRVAFAYDTVPPADGKSRLMFRITGAGDGKALLTFIQQEQRGGGTIKEEKGPKGESILVLASEHPPAVALIDNQDLILTGYDAFKGDHQALLRQILDVRAGKSPNVLKGPLAKDLQAVSAESRGLLAGTLPAEVRRELANSPLGVVPQRVVFELGQQQAATGLSITLRFRGTMEKEADTKALLDGFNTLKLMAVKALDELGKPKETIVLKKTVQSALLKGDGMHVTGETIVSAEAIQTALRLMMEVIPKEIRPIPIGEDKPPAKP